MKILLLIVFIFITGCSDNMKFTQLSRSSKITKNPFPKVPQEPEPITPPTPVTPPTPPVVQPKAIKEDFVQTQQEKVDLLIIKDISTSMAAEQKKLGARMHSLLKFLKDKDYHIGITTTDLKTTDVKTDGKLIPLYGTKNKEFIITNATADAEKKFNETMTKKHFSCTDCSVGSAEEPLRATMIAVKEAAKSNKDFFRADASFFTLVISDEDELSDRPSKATEPQAVYNFVTQQFLNKKFAYFGIVIEPGDAKCKKEQEDQGGWFKQEAHYGTAVSELANLSGGLTGNICDSDYAPLLEQMSEKMNEILFSIDLKEVPLDSSVVVSFIPAENRVNYHIKGNKLIFEKLPKQGTKISVEYNKKD